MAAFEEIVITVAERLREADIPYMMTGALTVNYFGRPRLTHDIDIVGQISINDIKRLRLIFEDIFFVDEHSIKIAISEKSMFSIIHKEEGVKVDFWILKGDEYNQKAFERRRWYPYQKIKISLATPEDMIIGKLEWYKMSGIEKHLEDASGIYYIQKDRLDLDYLEQWCRKKLVIDYLKKIRERR